MSYAVARAQLVQTVEAVVPLSTTRGTPSTFRHEPESGPDQLPGARAFYIRAADSSPGGVVGPYTPDIGGQPRMRVPITLTVVYPLDVGDSQALDEMIEEDRRQISRALLTTTNWGNQATGICWLDGGELLMPSQRETDEGMVLLVFTFDMVYR